MLDYKVSENFQKGYLLGQDRAHMDMFNAGWVKATRE